MSDLIEKGLKVPNRFVAVWLPPLHERPDREGIESYRIVLCFHFLRYMSDLIEKGLKAE